ncbi:esterase/lipase family protein [Chromatocurvus halotolerans]|uniref:Lecithin:cholesterol acyltransferase n=1 Tax=Chromatocurvus halotolerans TaxID=1132028 RepID=A0A4R2KVK4_9GAMM|nr:alpha/beta fold hydrolase [Chromatocurvus halotolerans]TCO77853.1 lecithin:cholesterol acyltransferase [Chromatocurvus halotolerans]
MRSRSIQRPLIQSLLLLTLAGCIGSPDKPDLARLYESAKGQAEQPPLILIPGVLGSRLKREDGTEAWPGSIGKLLVSRYQDLAMPIDEDTLQPHPGSLEPGALFDKAAGREYYSRIIKLLEGPGGYRRGAAGVAPDDSAPRYYVMTYDWRQDAVQSARELDRLIRTIRSDHASPDLRVDIIGHSMGGLIARYYSRYGTADVLNNNQFDADDPGASRLRRLVLVGTPNLGSIGAIRSLINGEHLGLRRSPPEVLMTMPAIYQLFPHALDNWLYTLSGDPLQRDQFDAAIWQRFRMGPWDPAVKERLIRRYGTTAAEIRIATLREYFDKQLERARRFTWSLSLETAAESAESLVFGGDCSLTPANLVVEEVKGESVLRLWPENIQHPTAGIDYSRLMLEPGDGTVTKASLLGREELDPTAPRHKYLHFAPRNVFFFCERHEVLTGNITFQDNLLHALLRVD